MLRQRPIELLAPAKNLECGMEAINHGADAVYIGAPRFGARAAAGNSLEDIEALVRYAHLYRVRIYVTVNTILKDEELAETEKMIWDLYRIGVDALIVQDMGITRLNLPPIPLHASTQMDNRTPQKVKFLAEAGFRQVVLARELTLDEIAKIHAACPETPLEVFVHGALCVSYSGQCYVSQACFGRSANRGECAQFCRLSFDMVDADGKMIARGKHLLSLKDMNQSENLEATYDKTVKEVKKVQEEVNNLMLQGDVLKENKELLEFQNGVNKIIKNGIHYNNNGKEIDWQQSVLMRYFGPIGKDMAQWEKDEQQALFDKGVLERLMKDIDAIATGKANEFSLAGMKFDLMQKQWEREDFELEQDKAASKLLDEMTGEGEYARLLGKFLKVLLGFIK